LRLWLTAAAVLLCAALRCSQLKYETGDHVGMYARNSEQVVARMAALLGLPLETSFKLHTEGEGCRCGKELQQNRAADMVAPTSVNSV
jgi:sulfite reductase alpha subunit-like flavoprotein